MMNWGSVALTLNVWKSDSPPVALVRFRLRSRFEVFSVNGTVFPLGSMGVIFSIDRRRDEFMMSHITPNMAANVAMEVHHWERSTAAITTNINAMVVTVDDRLLPFFFRDIVCFHRNRLAYWQYQRFPSTSQASRHPLVLAVG